MLLQLLDSFKMTNELSQKMYDALNGKHPNREGVKVASEYISIVSREPMTLSPYSFNTHCPDATNWRERYNPGVTLFDKGVLEAMVLIPEDAGQAKVRRIYWASAAAAGFLTPEYTEEAVSSLIDAYSRKFADSGEIFEKSWMFQPVSCILPNEMQRFAQHRDRIIAGLKSAYFNEESGLKQNAAALDNLAGVTRSMGINHSTDKEFIQAFWKKAMENPNGYLGVGAWKAGAEYLMEKNPQMVSEFEMLRRGVAEHPLSHLLWAIPVNQKAEDREKQRRGNLPTEVYAPIFDAVEKTITQ